MLSASGGRPAVTAFTKGFKLHPALPKVHGKHRLPRGLRQVSVRRRIEISTQTGSSQERFRPCPLLTEEGTVVSFVIGESCQKSRIGIALNNAVPDSGPALPERLFAVRPVDVLVPGKTQAVCVQLDKLRTGTCSLVRKTCDERAHTVLVRALPEISLV